MLPKSARVTRSDQYAAIFRTGLATHGTHLSIRVTKDTGPTQIGFIVGKRVSAKATLRNRTKRRLRALIADRYDQLPSDTRIAIIAKPGSEQLESSDLGAELDALLKQAKLKQKS